MVSGSHKTNSFANRRLPLRLLFAAILFVPLSSAADWKSLKPQGYVSDFSHVIDAASKASLEQYAAEVEHSTGAQMEFVTIPTLEGDPLEDVANDLFRAWGIGRKKEDNGVLFLLVTGDRRSRLEIGNGLEPILPDGLDGMLLVEMRPALRAGRYGEALVQAARRIGEIIAKDKGVSIQTGLPAPQTREEPVNSLPWPLILGGLVLLFFILRSGGGNFWAGMMLGNLLSGSGRRRYGGSGSGDWGGGFGGTDSGGGFGGFGGGDSGGGGASSDW